MDIKPNQLSSIISTSSGILNTAIDLGSITDNYQDDIKQVENQSFSPSGTYSLMNQFNNMNWGTPRTLQDFTGKTGKDYAKGILGATAAGASTGASIGGPYGALIGGAIGLVGSSIGAGIGALRGSDALEKYRRELADARAFAYNNWNTANTSFKQNQFDRSLMSFYRDAAYGGELDTHGSDFTNGIKYINAGGTHDQNPYGGVPMGVDEEGTPNLVEEGEVIVNDYVFSDRLKPSKSALEKSYLDPKLYGDTYARIAEKLAEASEEMANDAIEKNTLDTNLSRLMNIQEEARQKKAEAEGNQFGEGGLMNKMEYNEQIWEAKKSAKRYARKYAKAGSDKFNELYEAKLKELTAPIDARWELSQKTKESQESDYNRRKSLVEQMEKSGYVMKGSKDYRIKHADDFYNELVKQGLYNNSTPAVDGYSQEALDLEKELEEQAPLPQTEPQGEPETKLQEQQQVQQAKPATASSAKTAVNSSNTKAKKKAPATNTAEAPANNQESGIQLPELEEPVIEDPILTFGDIGPLRGSKSFDKIEMVPNPRAPKSEGPIGMDREWINNYTGPGEEQEQLEEEPQDWSTFMRYMPVLGNALALLGNRKDYSDVNRFEQMTANPRTVRFSPIGSYIRPNLLSPSELSTPITNQMNAERNYIRNNSLGNSTIANNYALASDYLGNAKIGAAYLQGKQYNAEQRQRAAAYNLGIDQYNSEGAFREQQQNMTLNDYYLQRALNSYQMRNNIDMAYNQAKSSNLTAMFNNLGNIGLDTFNRNRANAASPLYNQLSSGEIAYLRKLMEDNING